MSDVPDNANDECVGPASEQAGQASSCEGCPNQAACASGAGRVADPAIAQVQQRLSDIRHKLLILSGKGGVGKCFARHTRLRLFDGGTVAVQDAVSGTQLMGDDGLPRTITAGTLRQGVDTLYTVTPIWSGAESFTVTGAHILVLVNNIKPYLRKHEGKIKVMVPSLDENNRMVERCYTHRSPSRARAERRARLAVWRPLVWEVSVQDYLAAGAISQENCKLVAVKAITFNNPALPSLHAVLTTALGAAPTAAQHDYMAWWLGMWLTDGVSDRASISQGGAPPPDTPHDHEIFARLLDYTGLFNERVDKRDDKTTAGWPAYFFNYGADSVAACVLRSYGLFRNKHVPRALICDSLDVRRRLLAGIIDGDGYYTDTNVYEIDAKHHHVIRGYKELAATLGMRNSAVLPHNCINQQTGDKYAGFRIHLSGHMWDAAQYCVATYKRCPQPGAVNYVEKNKETRCYGFTITEVGDGEYFGFAVHGGINRRFLLEDYTVTHNSTVSSQLAWTLAESGYSVGILDVDITGPSIPRMMGVEGEEVRRSNFGWSPVYAADNLSVMSVAFMLASRNDAIIWRGPRKTGLIKQFLTDVDWQQLDFLLVDAPPGTSDEHISLAQYMSEAGIDGAVIVTTPQEVALLDVRKEINFCRKTNIPLLGVVENMSGFVCPCCQHQSEIFPAVTGGAESMCAEMDVPLLGRLPLDPAVLRACERGVCYLRECEREGKLDGKAAVAMRAMVQSVLQSTESLRETAKEHVVIGAVDNVKPLMEERKEASTEVQA